MLQPRTLTRRELYDLVWSKPMRDLAADFGISDVGLAKICDRHRIPKPGRGYWAKLAAGHKVSQALFQEVDDPGLNSVKIRLSIEKVPVSARAAIDQARTERNATKSSRPAPTVPVRLEPVQDVHKTVAPTAQALRRAKPNHGGAVFAIGEGLCGIDVGSANIERSIWFLDALARALDTRGLPIEPTGKAMRVVAGPDAATFTLKERTRREEHVPTREELAAEERRNKRFQRYWNSRHMGDLRSEKLFGRAYPDHHTVYTGALVFQIEGFADGVRRKWADGKTQRVEALVEDIVDGLEALLAVRKARREEWEERKRQWAEEDRRRELERRRAERERERWEFLKRLMELDQEAKRLREWLKSDGKANDFGVNTHLARMVAWAKGRLVELEAEVAADRVEEQLVAEELFPEQDVFRDP